MKAAITQLEISLATLTNNEPIHRAEGNAEQADMEAQSAAEIRQALDLLKGQKADRSLSFGQALQALKNGKRVARWGWNGKGMWIVMQRPDEHSKMTHPYLYIEYPQGHPSYPNGSRVPWLASQTDMLANDWDILD